MGAWGVKLYDSDTALDVKDEYIDLLKRGKINEQVTNELNNENEDTLSDEEEAAEFWFALADTQWKYGRLLPQVKEKALEYLDRKEHLERWEEAGEKAYKARIKILEDLKVQINSPMPPEKKVSKYRLYKCEWKVGDVFAYKSTSELSKQKGFYGKYILFRKVDEDIWWPGHIVPIVHVYKWIGEELPDLDGVNKLSYLPQVGTPEFIDAENDKVLYNLKLLNTSKRIIPISNLSYLGNIKKAKTPKNEKIQIPKGYPCEWKRFEGHIIWSFQEWQDVDI